MAERNRTARRKRGRKGGRRVSWDTCVNAKRTILVIKLSYATIRGVGKKTPPHPQKKPTLGHTRTPPLNMLCKCAKRETEQLRSGCEERRRVGMKRRPDWWSSVRSITQFSGYIDGRARSAHSLSSSLCRRLSSSGHTKRRITRGKGMGRRRRENRGLSQSSLPCNANANTDITGFECLLTGYE